MGKGKHQPAWYARPSRLKAITMALMALKIIEPRRPPAARYFAKVTFPAFFHG